MRTLLVVTIFVSIIFAVTAQFDGRYRFRPTFRPRLYEGRYRSSGDGRYRPSGDGRYRPAGDGKYRGDSDGRYRGGNDGKYVHMDVGGGRYEGGGGKYVGGGGQYSGGGQNSGSGGQYNSDGSGAYSGRGGQYTSGRKNKDDSEKIIDNSGRYRGSAESGNSGLGIGVNQIRSNSGSVFTQSELKPSTQGKGSAKGGSGWRILRDVNTVEEDGYHYLFETENGILAEEAGKIENKGTDLEGLRSEGFYEYTGDDGLLYRVDYVADTDGFIARGDHIPKTPRIIQKLVAYLATKPPVTTKA